MPPVFSRQPRSENTDTAPRGHRTRRGDIDPITPIEADDPIERTDAEAGMTEKRRNEIISLKKLLGTP
jgi:hypothetical protein